MAKNINDFVKYVIEDYGMTFQISDVEKENIQDGDDLSEQDIDNMNFGISYYDLLLYVDQYLSK